jgi:hypothetical protein
MINGVVFGRSKSCDHCYNNLADTLGVEAELEKNCAC